MDLNLIKQKLAEQQRQSSNNSNNNSKNLFWKPSVGKETIRIVPSKFNPSFPFSEMKFYYGIGPKPMASPSNFGDKDPIMEFTKQLRSSNDSENWKLAKKLDPKVRIMAPIVVRGREDEGVKIWQFGKEVYQAFLNMASDEEVGDFTDIVQGRDIKLTTVGPDVTGTKYNKTTPSPSMKTSPLADDATLVESLTTNQPDPSKVFKAPEYEVMKKYLQDYLMPEGTESEGDIISEQPVAFDNNQTPQSNYSQNTATEAVKKSKLDQFDDMFGEDDDLPF
jgi:hypothetical protein